MNQLDHNCSYERWKMEEIRQTMIEEESYKVFEFNSKKYKWLVQGCKYGDLILYRTSIKTKKRFVHCSDWKLSVSESMAEIEEYLDLCEETI